MKKLPDKTVERLSQYRRTLYQCLNTGKRYIFSHELGNLLHLTSVQVRRDIMLIGHSGTQRQGYDIKDLIQTIGSIIDSPQGQKVVVVGIGNLGRALMGYFSGKRTQLSIVAAFDTNPDKINRVFAGVPCYPNENLSEIIKKENISIGIITVPASEAVQVAETLVSAGIRGLLNFTPKPINVPPHVYLEEFDMITSLEKVAYFVKQ